MLKTEYFDFVKAAQELHVPDKVFADIVRDVKTEFPKDKMMFELHVLRAVKSQFWKKKSVRKVARHDRRLELAH